jgi:hypothetical protein
MIPSKLWELRAIPILAFSRAFYAGYDNNRKVPTKVQIGKFVSKCQRMGNE